MAEAVRERKPKRKTKKKDNAPKLSSPPETPGLASTSEHVQPITKTTAQDDEQQKTVSNEVIVVSDVGNKDENIETKPETPFTEVLDDGGGATQAVPATVTESLVDSGYEIKTDSDLIPNIIDGAIGTENVSHCETTDAHKADTNIAFSISHLDKSEPENISPLDARKIDEPHTAAESKENESNDQNQSIDEYIDDVLSNVEQKTCDDVTFEILDAEDINQDEAIRNPNVETVSSEYPNVDTVSSEYPNVETVSSEYPNVETVSSEYPNVETVSSEYPNVETVSSELATEDFTEQTEGSETEFSVHREDTCTPILQAENETTDTSTLHSNRPELLILDPEMEASVASAETFETEQPRQKVSIASEDVVRPSTISIIHEEAVNFPVTKTTESDPNLIEATRTSSTVRHLHSYRLASPEAASTSRPFTMFQLQTLYQNPLLENNEQFIDDFIQTEAKKENHEFYEILMNYLRARNSLLSAEEDVTALQHTLSRLETEVWNVSEQTTIAQGLCGDKVKCKAMYTFSICEFNAEVVQNIGRTLQSVRTHLQDQLSLHAYSAQLSRLQVESYVHRLFLNCPTLRDIPRNAPVQACLVHQQSPELLHQIHSIKECISVLFSFQRRPAKDEQFLKDTRAWIVRLVSALLRVASYNDHLFLVNHVLRCPGGVGRWASSFIQIPPPQLLTGQTEIGGPSLDFVVVILANILLPTKAREDFLCQMKITQTPDVHEDNMWILVDSDGEEDEDPANAWLYLHENDLVSILQQIPIKALYKYVLLMWEEPNGSPSYDVLRTSESQLLRMFAFFTCLINIFGCGLRTYSMARFRQLNKRLGRMIRHAIWYISDHWLNFRSKHADHLPPDMLQRLKIEFDQVFLRATYCILAAQRLGSWQYMSDMPYTCVSMETMWQLLWLLHQGQEETIKLDALPKIVECKAFISDPDSTAQLADRLQSLPTSEAIYLLTAFANMAQCRDSSEEEFIHIVTLEIYEIAYICNHTREVCAKVGRELLSSLGHAHPFTMSAVLRRTKDTLDQVGTMSLYLFRELPLHLWKPSDDDMTILRHWMMTSDLHKIESQLVQTILSKMNWELNKQIDDLVLPLHMHRQVAVFLVEAFGKFMDGQMGSSLIASMRQMAFVVRQQLTPEQQFNNWAWTLAARLHLHSNSIPKPLMGTTISSEQSEVPDLSADNTLLSIVKGVKVANPMACYVATMMTKYGHSVPEFIGQGLPLLTILAAQHHFKPLMNIMFNIIPQFIDCPHYLLGNDRFFKVLLAILTADESLIKFAKSLLSYDFPGPIIKLFSCMIQTQMVNVSAPGLNKGAEMMSFWFKMFFKVPRWYSDRNACYIMDGLVRTSFLQKGGVEMISELLYTQYTDFIVDEQKKQGMVSSIVSWIASGTVQMPSFMDRSVVSEFPWLAYMVLHTEGQYEIKTKFWPCLQQELLTNPTSGVDQAVRKTVINLKLDCAPISSKLNIYRWADQALNTSLDHPLLSAIWQRFFGLYLGRLTADSSLPQRAGAGEQFFDSFSYSSMMKKMKKRVAEASDYHLKGLDEKPKTGGSSEEGDSEEYHGLEDVDYVPDREFNQSLSRLYTTFMLWMGEPRLHDANLYLPALPPQYMADRLLSLFQNQNDPWMDFVDTSKAVYESAQMTSEWMRQMTEGSHGNRSPDLSLHMDIASAKERILNRLTHHGTATLPPTLTPLKSPVPDISLRLLEDKDSVLHLVNSDLAILKNYTKLFSERVSNRLALDYNYVELLPDEYRNEWHQKTLILECKSMINPLHSCKGPKPIQVRLEERTQSEIVHRKLVENRAEYKQLMIEGLLPPPQNICICVVHVENLITTLIKTSQLSSDTDLVLRLADIGNTLFFHLAYMVTDETNFYPPTRQFFSSCLEILGQVFVRCDPSQAQVLLQFVLDNPNLAGLLSPHFAPNGNPQAFVWMHQQLIDVPHNTLQDLKFMLVTKFDVKDWLKTCKPLETERLQFIEHLSRALCKCGKEPDKDHDQIFELYLGHFKIMLEYQFPLHLSPMLNLLLTGSALESIHPRCWEIFCDQCFDANDADLTEDDNLSSQYTTFSSTQNTIINQLLHEFQVALGYKALRPEALEARGQNNLEHNVVWKMSVVLTALTLWFTSIMRQETRNQFNTALTAVINIKEILEWLGNFFSKERRNSSNNLSFGLYPKWLPHVSHIAQLVEGLLKDLTLKMLAGVVDIGPLQVLDYVWQLLLNVFSPWVQVINHKQMLSTPWIETDNLVAKEMVLKFMNIVEFLHRKLSGLLPDFTRGPLSTLWMHYIGVLCQPGTPSHVIAVYNDLMSQLPWEQLKPELAVIESMVQMKGQATDECFQMLISIFPKIDWSVVLVYYQTTQPGEATIRVTRSVFQGLMQMFVDKRALENEEFVALLMAAIQFPWNYLDSTGFKGGISELHQSCDPKCVLSGRTSAMGIGIRLLKSASHFTPEMSAHWDKDLSEKRVRLVTCLVELLCRCSFQKDVDPASIGIAVTNLVTEMETVEGAVSDVRVQQEESLHMIQQVFSLLNNCNPEGGSSEVIMTTIIQWLQSSPHSILLMPCIRGACRSLASLNHMAQIVETCIEVHFMAGSQSSDGTSWDHVLSSLQVPELSLNDYIVQCLTQGAFLSLFAYHQQQLPLCQNLDDEIQLCRDLLEWMSKAKSNCDQEAKVLLWMHSFMALLLRQMDQDTSPGICTELLNTFIRQLVLFGEDRASSGILSVIGFGRKSTFSLSFRLSSRAVCAFLANQILKEKVPRREVSSTDISLSTKFKQTVSQLKALKNNKQYAALTDNLEFCIGFVEDPANTIRDVQTLIKYIAQALYPEREYLLILKSSNA